VSTLNLYNVEKRTRKSKIVLISFYSENYPIVSETYALLALSGYIKKHVDNIDSLHIIDMVYLKQDKYKNLLEKLENINPSIIGLSINYGCFENLRNIYPKIKNIISKNNDYLTIFGGAIPTYLPELMLKEIDSSGFVVIGEGEDAIVSIINNWKNFRSITNIDNTCYVKNGSIKYEKRSLINLSKVPAPYRPDLNVKMKHNINIFVETSRGCSTPGCTFCTRGLTDLRGKRSEYRRCSMEKIEDDLKFLQNSGVKSFGVTDEDFLKGSDTYNNQEKFVTNLENIILKNNISLKFDVSMTVSSIYSSEWDTNRLGKQKQLLKRLKTIGLTKIFLGVESFSKTQLFRYSKGFLPSDAVKAIRILEDIGINIMIGFIMFDPLCCIDEVKKNINTLISNNFVQYISGIASELRLQKNCKYINILEQEEKKRNLKLYDRKINPETLSYNYEYINNDIVSLISVIREYNKIYVPLYDPLKNISRYDNGILSDHTFKIRKILIDMKIMYSREISFLINDIENYDYILPGRKQHFYLEILEFYDIFSTTLYKASVYVKNHYLVRPLLKISKKLHAIDKRNISQIETALISTPSVPTKLDTNK